MIFEAFATLIFVEMCAAAFAGFVLLMSYIWDWIKSF